MSEHATCETCGSEVEAYVEREMGYTAYYQAPCGVCAQATVTGDVAPRARVLGEALRAAVVTTMDAWWAVDMLQRATDGPELDAEEVLEVEARLRALGVEVA